MLYRPQVLSDECAVSYLIRVSERNGFRHIGYLLNYAGLQWKNLRVPVHQILTGEFELGTVLQNLELVPLEPNTKSVYQEFRREVDTSSIFVKNPKVCPECLLEDGYCKSQWAFLPVLACSKHRKTLIDIHPETGVSLSWYREKLDKFDGKYETIVCRGEPPPVEVLQLSGYFEALATGNPIKTSIPPVTYGLEFREALTIFNFLAHYEARLLGKSFRPISLDNHSLAQHYRHIWKMLIDWPDSFYLLLSQYVDQPMSRRGVAGINKHFRDLYQCLYRQQENQGMARIKVEFDRYIETYWPGLLQPNRITRINLTSPSRSIVSKKEAARIIGCRPERIAKLVCLNRLSQVIFKGKAHYKCEEVQRLADLISSNWSMKEACEALQLTRYQLKQLLDSELISVHQKPDQFNRDWIIDKAQCQGMVIGLIKKARSRSTPNDLLSMEGVQRQGFSIAQLIMAMQTGQIEYGVCLDKDDPFSLKQFTSFNII